MNHLQLTPEAPPLVDDRIIPIDDPDEPITEAVQHELELDRAADEGMIEPPGLPVPIVPMQRRPL